MTINNRYLKISALVLALLCGVGAIGGCSPRTTNASQPSQIFEMDFSSAAPQQPTWATPEEEPSPEEAAPQTEEQPVPPLRPQLQQAVEQGDKLVALTFDDGPYDPNTKNMLELLEQHEIVATFFLVGKNAQSFPQLAREIVEQGHEIGNHTYDHLILPDLDSAAFAQQVEGNAKYLEQLTGRYPASLRPPGGRLSDKVIEQLSQPVLLWSVDPRDWDTTDDEEIFRHVIEHTGDGDIVLMHDVYKATVRAAAKIIPALKEQGFFFVTVSELIAVRGTDQTGPVIRSLAPTPAQ